MRPIKKVDDNPFEENTIEILKKVFKNCKTPKQAQIRLNCIYKGKNPEKMTEEERFRNILTYLHPEKTEEQIRREAVKVANRFEQVQDLLSNVAKEIDEIELPEIDIDIPELDFKDEDFDFNLPEIEIDSTELDKQIEEITIDCD